MIYKTIPLLDGDEVISSSEQDLDDKYNNKYVDECIYLKLIRKGYKMGHNYCYNYALKDKYVDSCEDGLEILHSIYYRISLKQLKKGDIITFFTDEHKGNDINNDNVQHFGIVKKTDNTLDRTIILSKWGEEGIFETNLNTLPDFFGSKICFWRKRM